MTRLIFLLILLTGQGACSTLTRKELNSKSDYAPAVAALGRGHYDKALERLPDGEEDGFITTFEAAWLGLLAGRPVDNKALTEFGEELEEERLLRVARLGTSFFYKETADGYFPGEHEAILLHIVNGMLFARQGEFEAARVEARRASFYLETPETSGGNRDKVFDDAGLRLWLGALWLAAGSWSDARVDFRRAAAMAPRPGFLRELAERPEPPGRFFIALSGPGPEVSWQPQAKLSMANGLARLTFEPGSKAQPLRRREPGQKPVPLRAFAGKPWYKRHQQRNHEIRDVLEHTRYVTEGLLATGAAGVGYAAGAATGVVISATGIALGVGIGLGALLVGAKIGGDLGGAIALIGLGGGGSLAAASVETAEDVYDESTRVSQKLVRDTMDLSEKYRFVRFLPDFIYAGSGGPEAGPSLTL